MLKKSTTYRQTFRRHRLLLIAPIVIAVLIAGALTVSSAKSYESTASLWVDNPTTESSSLGNLNPAMTPPSAEEQGVLTELLATGSFDLAVGHDSLLASYLASHQSGGISSILGGGGGSVDGQILEALAPANVMTSTPGPQVLQISFTGPSPTVAHSTLVAILAQLQKGSATYAEGYSESSLSYYQSQVNTAAQALSSARNQADAYRAQHPNAPTSDPNLAAFSSAETSAGNQLSAAQAKLSEAQAGLKGAATANLVRTIDTPSYPSGPTTGKKKELEGIAAGLLAGLVVSFLGMIALTRRESDPWEDELAEAAGAASRVPAPAYAHEPQSAYAAAPISGATASNGNGGVAAVPNGNGGAPNGVGPVPVPHGVAAVPNGNGGAPNGVGPVPVPNGVAAVPNGNGGAPNGGSLGHEGTNGDSGLVTSSSNGASLEDERARSLAGNEVQPVFARRKFSR